VLYVGSPHVRRLPRGHTQLLLVEDRRRLPPGQEVGPTILQAELDADQPAAEADVPPIPGGPSTPGSETRPTSRTTAPPAGNRANFFRLGVAHILGGYDHLLFVAALLLACRTLREAATIITFFTVAHTITLALAALDVARLGGAVVEPAIAATILFVGVENLFRTPPLRWRCAVTFGFGLVHGLGFAGDLRDMLPGSTFGQVAWPLLTFAAGVEAGHLGLVAAALPLLLLMKRRSPRVDRYLTPALSAAIAAAGGFWLVTRVWAEVRGGG
jgi:hydrogenase/urease accessory protein HupE